MAKFIDEQTINLEQYLAMQNEYIDIGYKAPDPLEYIKYKKSQMGLSNKEVASKLDLSESYISKYLKGNRKSRESTIKICIVLQCTLVELNQILKYMGLPILYAKHKRDQIIIHGLLNKLSIYDINRTLINHDIKKLL